MAEIRIRIGAVVDSSVEAVFPRIEKAVSRARRAVERDFGEALPRSVKSGTDKAQKAFDLLAAELSGEGSKMMNPATKAVDSFAKESLSRFADIKKSFADLTRVAEREMKAQERAQRSGGMGPGEGGAGEGGRYARRVGYWSMRNFSPVTPMLGIGRRVAGDLARGVGVDMNVGSMMQSYVSRQKLAQDIANSAYQPGEAGAAGKLQDAGAIQLAASGVAKATATDPTAALEGLQKFVGVTGDLETGRAVLGDMAKLARATGANLEHVVSASAEVSAKLGDVPNKTEAINAIMRQVAGQGQRGAVEMRDFAKQLASVAAVAPRFAGSTQQNIGEMAILLQEARQLGGAKSAAQAATGVSAFANVFDKGGASKAWRAIGVKTRDEKGQLYSPETLILEALRHTKGDSTKMAALMGGSSMARRATRGFETIYQRAGGGHAGEAAVVAEFDRLRKAAMSGTQVNEAFARSMQTAEAKAKTFQNQLQDIADRTATKLLPAMERLAPKVEQMANIFGDVVTWAAENPWKAVVAALGASILKAGIENAIRSGVERLVASAVGGSGEVGLGGVGRAGGGAVGGALAVGAAFVGGWKVGELIADRIVGDIHGNMVQSTNDTLHALNVSAGGNVAQTEAEIAKQRGIVSATAGRVGSADEGGGRLLAGLLTVLNPAQGRALADEKYAQQLEELKLQTQTLNKLEQHLATIKGQGGGLHADQSGRAMVSFSRGR